ncbi:MAG TPA: helix-turn-helix transcriptional regulator [Firmicutes bacterium]|nr:helix-turn-helix transcriptional regulator [Bacillota bacterium]
MSSRSFISRGGGALSKSDQDNQVTEILEQVSGEILPDELANKLAETFRVLGDPTRIRIIHLLFQKPRCVGDIAQLLDMSQSAISHQLRSLRNMRLVKYYREGKNVIYSLDDDHIVGLFKEGLDHILHD